MEHRDHCEKCNKPLNDQDEAYICYYECTWCAPCTVSFNYVCPNCGGELVRRPRLTPKR